MAWIGKIINPNTGTVAWKIQFQKGTGKKREAFSASFKTEEEARKFCDEWEHVYFLEGEDAVKYDRLYERRRRKFYDKIVDKT